MISKKREKEKIKFRRNFAEYYSFLKKYKPVFILILVSILVVELTRLAPKYLFKIVIDEGSSFAAGNLIRSEFVEILLIILGIYVGLGLFEVIFVWLRVHLLAVLDSKVVLDIKRKYFNHIVDLDYEFHTSHKTGSLISRLTRSSSAAEMMTDILAFNFLPTIIGLIVSALSIAYFSLISGLIIGAITLVFVAYSLYIQNIQQKAKLIYNKQLDREKANVADIFTNIETIKYFGKSKPIQNKFLNIAKNTKNKGLKYWFYYRWFDSGQVVILTLGTVALLYFPIVQFLNQEITLGTIAFIYTVYFNIIGSMFEFVWGVKGFYRAMSDFQELFDYSDIENQIKDKPNAKDIDIKKGKIEFKNVDFSYYKEGLFNNFNLKIPPNKKIALVGDSGCGKSTLIKLLYRLYDVDSGEILIDGNNVKDVKQDSLREEMSIVPQEPILFDDTIYKNVKFSNPRASKEEIMEAIKFAQLDKVIKNLPKKENTIVGERGIKLSGGEKQRVSIARAILANKKILVLDEATSALDSKTEWEIQKDLENLMKGRTSIIIAHRLSTIMNADLIVVMKEGKIIQKGTHRELITEGGEYQKLWDYQKGGYIE